MSSSASATRAGSAWTKRILRLAVARRTRRQSTTHARKNTLIGTGVPEDEAPHQAGGEEAVVEALVHGERLGRARPCPGVSGRSSPVGLVPEEHLEHEELHVQQRHDDDGMAAALIYWWIGPSGRRRTPLRSRVQRNSAGSASAGPGAFTTSTSRAIGSKSARKCTELLSATMRLARGSTPTMAEHLLVGGLALARGEHDPHAGRGTAAQQRHRAERHPEALEHRPGAGEAAVAQALDGEFAGQRRIARDAGTARPARTSRSRPGPRRARARARRDRSACQAPPRARPDRSAP